jgi:hypothetical protein
MLIDLVEDYTDYVNDNGQVAPDDLAARLEELRNFRADYEGEGMQMPAREADELRMLVTFVAEVERAIDGDFSDATIVTDHEFEKYIRWNAESQGYIDIEVMGVFLDWPRYIDAFQKAHFTQLELDGQTVWVQ